MTYDKMIIAIACEWSFDIDAVDWRKAFTPCVFSQIASIPLSTGVHRQHSDNFNTDNILVVQLFHRLGVLVCPGQFYQPKAH